MMRMVTALMRLAFFTLAGVVGLALPADAATMATSVTYWTSTPIAADTVVDWSSTLAFAKFNPALGTLTKVNLYLESDMDSKFTAQNIGNAKKSFRIQDEITLTLSDPANAFVADAPQVDCVFPTDPFRVTLAPGAITNSPVYYSKVSTNFVYTAAAVLAEFTGVNAIALTVEAQAAWVASGGGSASIIQLSHAGVTGFVTYDYSTVLAASGSAADYGGDVIPEPSAAVLAGLGGLIFFWRRRLSKNTRSL